ncbi:LDCC motif putative metal-binding protein [Mobilitalea sibirica]|nr:LDCC motif putative metal-binding protein [Mobilitalea sibirica]
MKLWTKIKKSFNNYLNHLAEENKKAFGEGKLDCCSLSKQENKK